jgi:predicted RNA-binding protein with PUA-like domain
MLRDEFKAGDLAFMYHSSCDEPGVVGVVEIVRAGYPDPTQFDKKHDHYDPGSKADAPRWYGVDVRLRQRLSRVIGLDELRSHPALREFRLLQRGNRLSVMPVSASHWRCIMGLEKKVR